MLVQKKNKIYLMGKVGIEILDGKLCQKSDRGNPK